MTAALAIKSFSPADSDPIAVLRTERAKLQAEQTRHAHARARLDDAARAENEALQALDELSRAEGAAMREWASAGAAGDAPKPKTAEREKLTAGLAEAASHAAAARSAIGDIEQLDRDLRDRLAALHSQITFRGLEILAGELDGKLVKLKLYVDQVNLKIAEVMGLSDWAAEAGRAAQSRGDAETATMFFRLAERFADLKVPEFGSTMAEVEAAGKLWQGRYNALTGDA